MKYAVIYYDAKLSRAGKGGVRTRTFDERAEAEAFAAANRCWAKPCQVRELHRSFDRAGQEIWVTIPEGAR